MDTQRHKPSRGLTLEEVRIPLHRAGFGNPCQWRGAVACPLNGTPLCRITGKGSVFYRREDADTP